MNITLLIPGFGENKYDDNYIKILSLDSNIEILNINWNYKTFDNWYNEVVEFINKNYSNHNQLSIIGFSFGAMIALKLAENFKFKKVHICSLSPYFDINLNKLPKEAINFIGIRRYNNFKNISIPKKIKCDSINFYFGDKDWPYAILQAENIAKFYNKKLITIKDLGHDFDERYFGKIK